MNNDFKYSYRILGCSDSLSIFSYSDLNELEDYDYIDDIYNGLTYLERKYFRVAFSTFVFSHFKYFPKGQWKNRLCRHIKKPSKRPCFIIAPSWLAFYPEIDIPNILRTRYPNCKLVLFFNDLIGTYFTYRNIPFDMKYLKNKFDKIISFDKGDCAKYNIDYYPLVFSKFRECVRPLPETDVYFLGKAKNRLSEILTIFKYLRNMNLVLDFHIAGVDKKDRIFEDEIDYNPNMNYYDNLQHVFHTKCLLEVMQKGGIGYTQRVFEAIGMKKKLITNNQSIIKAPFYDPDLIMSYKEVDDINSVFIERLNEKNVNYRGSEEISPIFLLKYLDKSL